MRKKLVPLLMALALAVGSLAQTAAAGGFPPVIRDAEIEKMRNQKEAYSQQAILLSDLLKQQSSLADAEGQYHQAVLVYWSARADFQKSLGEE